MGYLADGRAVFAVGPLPGELARVAIQKQRRSYAEATLREIIEPSSQRSLPAEDHCLVCSPWQGVVYSYQLELKEGMLKEAYAQHLLTVAAQDFVPAQIQLGYRNRLDFTVTSIEGKLQLAFHARGSWDNFIPLPAGCLLGSEEMNRAAQDLVDQLNTRGFEIEQATITLRHARATNQLLTILTTKSKANWSDINTAALGNFLVTSPLQGSGAPGPITYQSGDSYITDKLAGLEIAYPYNAFFQSNTAVFEKALNSIVQAITPATNNLVELYSGVGAIGLPIASRGVAVHGIETTPEAVEFAERNARANGVAHYSAETIAAEFMDNARLRDIECVILDPPRAGLHPRVIRWLLEARPKQLIYLSCNPVTQARDIALLQPTFQCDTITGFDFYPGTLHLEALAILS